MTDLSKMMRISPLLAVTALSCLSDASSLRLQDSKSFTVNQVSAGTEVRNGALALMKAYNKYAHLGASAPAHLVQAAEAAKQSGSVAVHQNLQAHSQFFSIPISAGGQKLNLQLDSGSSDLWVFSSLQSANETSGRPVYDPSKSTTAHKLDGFTWDVGYGDGSAAAGVVYADKVVIGGVTATSQAVEAATSASGAFIEETFLDGLIGMGLSKLNQVKPKQQQTFFDNIKSNLSQPIWTVDIKYNTPGSVDFGFLNSSKYTGKITYNKVYGSKGYWFIEGSTLIAANSTNQVATLTPEVSSTNATQLKTVLIDTGTSINIIPAEIAEAYYQNVKGAKYSYLHGGYMFPCSTTPPGAEVNIGGATYTIPGKYISYVEYPDGQCFGGIQPNDGLGLNILGDVFIKSVYTVFDETGSGPRIGFAAKPVE